MSISSFTQAVVFGAGAALGWFVMTRLLTVLL